MVNEEIVGGLRLALERGESMNKAMMTFFNAGYTKEEIEEAAKTLSQMPAAAQIQPPARTSSGIVPAPPKYVQQPPQPPSVPGTTNSSQKASGYGEKKNDSGDKKNRLKLLFIILIGVFVLVVGMLIVTLLLR